MKHILNISKHLVFASLVTGLLMFLPVTGAFIEKVPAGFLVVAGVVVLLMIVVGRLKRRVAHFDVETVVKEQAEANAAWEKTRKATFSLSSPLDLRNMNNDD